MRRTLWNRIVGRVLCWVRGHRWTVRRSFDVEWDFCYRCWNAVSKVRLVREVTVR